MQNINHNYFNIERRSKNDRREFILRDNFPLYDCDNFLVVKDRRYIPERRISNIQISYHSLHNL